MNSRPDYLVMVYSAGRPTQGEQLKSFPPTFLLAAAADKGAANGSAQLWLDMNPQEQPRRSTSIRKAVMASEQRTRVRSSVHGWTRFITF